MECPERLSRFVTAKDALNADFFEPKWETLDGKYSDYITVNQANRGFPYYRRIGKYVWNHDANKENKEMKEIKVTIDGKEVQLTEEQLRLLGIEPKKKNPFDRVGNGDRFFAIDNMNGIQTCTEMSYARDEAYYNGINYFNDKKFAKQVALHQLLYRKLLKFAYDNECEDTAEWDGSNKHWAVRYNYAGGARTAYYQSSRGAQEVYFSSEEGAKRAIKEVVEPFMKEHPDFVW